MILEEQALKALGVDMNLRYGVVNLPMGLAEAVGP